MATTQEIKAQVEALIEQVKTLDVSEPASVNKRSVEHHLVTCLLELDTAIRLADCKFVYRIEKLYSTGSRGTLTKRFATPQEARDHISNSAYFSRPNAGWVNDFHYAPLDKPDHLYYMIEREIWKGDPE